MSRNITSISFATVIGLALALMVSAVPSFAQAQMSSAEKDAEIDRLTSIIEQLTASLNAGGGVSTFVSTPASSVSTSIGTVAGVSTAACPYVWQRDLSIGARGIDVLKLQQFLNTDPDTRVAVAGAGSPGFETQYYGPLTANAVSRFQAKYATEVLFPLGLTSPTGYFGAMSRAKANALCATTVTPPADDEDRDRDDDDDANDDDDEDRDRDDLIDDLRGEGTLDVFEIDDAADDEIEEGAEDEEIAEITMEADHGDILVDRIDIALVGINSPEEEDPWDVFETVTLRVDGDRIAEFDDADDEDEYLDEDDGTIRFSDIGLVLEEGEEVEMTIEVSVQNGIDGAGTDADWTVSVEEIRYFDADFVATDEDDVDELGDAVQFSIVEEGEGDELRVRSSSEDPDATTLQLEDDENSDWIRVFAFDLDTDDSENDIEIEEILVEIDATDDGSTPTSTAFLIDDAQLVIDGEEFDDVEITHGTTGTFRFDIDGDLVIDAGDEVTVELELEFEALDDAFEGATIEASVDADDIDAEGADDLGPSQLEGAATGEEHTLRTSGVILEFEDEDFDFIANSDTTADDDEGVFTLEFEVTAFETDIFLNRTATRGTASTDAGAEYSIVSGGSTVGGGVVSASLSSTGDIENGDFEVEEGETETFTLKVVFDPDSSGFYALQLNNINFTTVAGGSTFQSQTALPESDFETDEFSI